jgi:hypothetical protein
MFLLHGPGGVYLVGAGYAKGLTAEEFNVMTRVSGITHYYAGDNQRAVDVILDACQGGSGPRH